MSDRQQDVGDPGSSRSRRRGAGVLLTVVAFLAVTVGLVLASRSSSSVQRVVVILEGTGDDDFTFAQCVYVVECDNGIVRVEAVDPDAEAHVSGTSAETVRDAYAFGGGSAIAAALAKPSGRGGAPFVVVPSERWTRSLDKVGGVRLTVPREMHVLVRPRFYSLAAGPQVLSGGATSAFLIGMEADTNGSRAGTRAEVAEAIADALLVKGPAGGLLAFGKVETSLSEGELKEFVGRLSTARTVRMKRSPVARE